MGPLELMVWQADLFHLWAGRPILLLAVACGGGALVGHRWLTTGVAVLAFILAAYDMIDLWSDAEARAVASVGFGPYLVALCAIVAVVAGLQAQAMSTQRRTGIFTISLAALLLVASGLTGTINSNVAAHAVQNVALPKCAGATFAFPVFGGIGWTYRWPYAGDQPIVGGRDNALALPHQGIDIFPNGDTTVYAIGTGRVYLFSLGKDAQGIEHFENGRLKIYHEKKNIFSYYTHVTNIVVSNGELVEMGHPLASVDPVAGHVHLSLPENTGGTKNPQDAPEWNMNGDAYGGANNYPTVSRDPSELFAANLNWDTSEIAKHGSGPIARDPATGLPKRFNEPPRYPYALHKSGNPPELTFCRSSVGSSGTNTAIGGNWVAVPTTGSTVKSTTVALSADTSPAPAGPAIDHVNFTIWWDGANSPGPKEGPWKPACPQGTTRNGNRFSCTLDLQGLGAPHGATIWISFDVYDQGDSRHLSPDGERSFTWSPSNQAVLGATVAPVTIPTLPPVATVAVPTFPILTPAPSGSGSCATPPTLVSPVNGATIPQSTSIVLTWSTSCRSSYAELSGAPYDTMNFGGWKNATNITIGQMWPGTYTWHVKVKDASGKVSGWSPSWTFTVGPIAGAGGNCDSNTQPAFDQIVLYQGNYRDQCVIKGVGEYRNEGEIGLNGITSIKVGDGVQSLLCEKENFGDPCDMFTGGALGFEGRKIQNDHVLSVRVEKRPVQPTPPPAGTWKVRYFKQGNLTDEVFPGPETAPGPFIKASWDGSNPFNGNQLEHFSVRWEGDFDFPGGAYTFIANGDDGVRLKVDGNELISHYDDDAATWVSTPRDLASGSHHLEVDYQQRTGGAHVEVWWTGPGYDEQHLPLDPRLIGPAEGETVGASPTLSWEAVPGATDYHAEYWTTGLDPQTLGWSSATSWTLPPLNPGVTYLWDVRARGAGGVSAPSLFRRFTTDATRPPDVTIDPAAATPPPVATDAPTAEATATPKPLKGGSQVEVAANAGWVDTGIAVPTRPDAVGFTWRWQAWGTIQINADNVPFGPDGDSPCTGDANWPGPSLPCSALIGRFGPGGQPFYVGSVGRSGDMDPLPAAATLWLTVNDAPDAFGDNRGAFTVNVRFKTQRAPMPQPTAGDAPTADPVPADSPTPVGGESGGSGIVPVGGSQPVDVPTEGPAATKPVNPDAGTVAAGQTGTVRVTALVCTNGEGSSSVTVLPLSANVDAPFCAGADGGVTLVDASGARTHLANGDEVPVPVGAYTAVDDASGASTALDLTAEGAWIVATSPSGGGSAGPSTGGIAPTGGTTPDTGPVAEQTPDTMPVDQPTRDAGGGPPTVDGTATPGDPGLPDVALSALPDGPVVFGMRLNRQWDVFTSSEDGSLVQLTNLPGSDEWSPVWSHDRGQVAYLSDAAGGSTQIWTMAADGSGRRQITDWHGDGEIVYAAWDLDDQRIFAVVVSSGRARILSVSAAGGDLARAPTAENAGSMS